MSRGSRQYVSDRWAPLEIEPNLILAGPLWFITTCVCFHMLAFFTETKSNLKATRLSCNSRNESRLRSQNIREGKYWFRELSMMDYLWWIIYWELSMVEYLWWIIHGELSMVDHLTWIIYCELYMVNYLSWTIYGELSMLNYLWWFIYVELSMVNDLWWIIYGGLYMVDYLWWIIYGEFCVVDYLWWIMYSESLGSIFCVSSFSFATKNSIL